jgi:predicted ArsR family transcriptional regulator
MTPWDDRFLKSTAGRLVQSLRERDQSARELAGALGVTTNAVRAHLPALEREGLVQVRGLRPGVRRPETVYGLTAGADRLFGRAYGLVLRLVLEALEGRLPGDERERMLGEIGQRLGAAHRPAAGGPLADRVAHAAGVLNTLGGLTLAEPQGDRWVLRGLSCPLAELGAGHPEACLLARALVEEIAGAPVAVGCHTDAAPRRCVFEVSAP